MQYEFHPLANIFPLIEGQPFNDLVADIRVHGVREPVWLHDGKILDGRNRYRAALAAGVDCPVREYEGIDPVEFVVSLNLHRRHLNESQRAMVAARLANMVVGGCETNSANLQNCQPVSQSDAARLLNVSTRSVTAATKVKEEAAPEVVKAVECGSVSVSAAASITSLPKEEQSELIQAGPKAVKAAAAKQRAKPKRGAKADAIREEIKAVKEHGDSMLCAYARQLLNVIRASDEVSEEEQQLLEEVAGAIENLTERCFA